MFFVFSKDKIISYIASFCMVMALLGMAFYIKNNSETEYVSTNNVVIKNDTNTVDNTTAVSNNVINNAK